MLLKMAADWLMLADTVAKREGKAKRTKSPPEPEGAPELVVARPEKPRKLRAARKGSPTGLKVSVQRTHSTRASQGAKTHR
jgi:hypothetical protein